MLKSWDSSTVPVAVTRNGGSVLFMGPVSETWSVAAIGRSARRLFPTTGAVWGADAAPDGSVYVDQVERPAELLRLVGGHAQRVAVVNGPASSRPTEFAPLPDGRTVWQQDVAGRPRLVVVEPGHDAVPLTSQGLRP